jgi:hypothetical protein
MTAIQVAARVLPPREAARIINGTIRGQTTPWQRYHVRFWERPEPVGAMICRRQLYFISLMDLGPPAQRAPDGVLEAQQLNSIEEFATTYPRPATQPNCDAVSGYVYGHVRNRQRMLDALGDLTQVVRAASGSGNLPFAVHCGPEEESVCRNPRDSLATLPLHDLQAISLDIPERPFPNVCLVPRPSG